MLQHPAKVFIGGNIKMKTILVTGALGQIGSELVMHLRKTYGGSNVIASDVVKKDMPAVLESGPFEQLNVLEPQKVADVCKKYKVDTVIHLAALLSAVAERDPQMAFNINIHGLYNMLEIARENKYRFFVPSSIAAFGPSTPKDKTPQDTIQRPTSMYGVTKVSGELLCDYYHKRFGVDTRGVRFPGLISYTTPPGGGKAARGTGRSEGGRGGKACWGRSKEPRARIDAHDTRRGQRVVQRLLHEIAGSAERRAAEQGSCGSRHTHKPKDAAYTLRRAPKPVKDREPNKEQQ